MCVLVEYWKHAEIVRGDRDTDDMRQPFYKNLSEELIEGWVQVDKESRELWITATQLSRLEFRPLDNDGKTTKLEEWISKGADVFRGEQDVAKQKYKRLISTEFVEIPLATFELFYVDHDGGIDRIAIHMRKGDDILDGWPQEVQEEYGWLRRYLPAKEKTETQSPS